MNYICDSVCVIPIMTALISSSMISTVTEIVSIVKANSIVRAVTDYVETNIIYLHLKWKAEKLWHSVQVKILDELNNEDHTNIIYKIINGISTCIFSRLSD